MHVSNKSFTGSGRATEQREGDGRRIEASYVLSVLLALVLLRAMGGGGRRHWGKAAKVASSLCNISDCLSNLVQREEALQMSEEAVRIYRTLAADKSDTFRRNVLSTRIFDLYTVSKKRTERRNYQKVDDHGE